jgi:hypothetical protein
VSILRKIANALLLMMKDVPALTVQVVPDNHELDLIQPKGRELKHSQSLMIDILITQQTFSVEHRNSILNNI